MDTPCAWQKHERTLSRNHIDPSLVAERDRSSTNPVSLAKLEGRFEWSSSDPCPRPVVTSLERQRPGSTNASISTRRNTWLPGLPRFAQHRFTVLTALTTERDDRVLKLERVPIEVLLFLVDRRGEVVSRKQTAERIWGKCLEPLCRCNRIKQLSCVLEIRSFEAFSERGVYPLKLRVVWIPKCQIKKLQAQRGS
jgi:hypothetical protein